METSAVGTVTPLGLSLDFMFGRGYLSAQRQRLSDWITLESLRMEIPDLAFPFDARGGVGRFQHTRALVRDVEFSVSEVGFAQALAEAALHLDGFEDLNVRFLEGAAHISFRLKALGLNTYISFRAALIPPEPCQDDEVHLSLYDYRAYGTLPYPARLIVHEFVTGVLNHAPLRAPGRGTSFSVGIAGDILSFHPIKLFLLSVFPKVGWKLPGMAGVVLDSAQIRPGVMTLRAVAPDEHLHRSRSQSSYHIASSPEGARALAAYEAKSLFSQADQALFEGRVRESLQLLPGYRDLYGLHPELGARMLDCLLVDPTPGNLAEVQILCADLFKDDPQNIQGLLANAVVAKIQGSEESIIEAFNQLSAELRTRSDSADWILCELSVAYYLKENYPREAAQRLREVLKLMPRNKMALELLSGLYERLSEFGEVESLLKRLTGVYTDRETLKKTYLTLARHLIDRSGDLAEARLYLEKVLRLDPTELQALFTLGECYVLGGEPLRALKVFGTAARAAESINDIEKASYFHFRVAKIWGTEIGHHEQALLSCRRALALNSQNASSSNDRASRIAYLRYAAELSNHPGNQEEAINYWTELISLLEKQQSDKTDSLPLPESFAAASDSLIRASGKQALQDQSNTLNDQLTLYQPTSQGDTTQSLVEANYKLATIYEARERWQIAATHWRRILELEPRHNEAAERLERYLLQAGLPEQLVALYQGILTADIGPKRQEELYCKLAQIYQGLGAVDDAIVQLENALNIHPDSEVARQRLLALLDESASPQKVEEILSRVLPNIEGRQGRFDIMCTLAQNWVYSLNDSFRGARAYLEALQLFPANLHALKGAVHALRQYVEQNGPNAYAPAGSHGAGQLLERLLVRLSELSTDVEEQYQALRQYANLVEQRGDISAAAEARDRAEQLEAMIGLSSNGSAADVDQRLELLLDDLELSSPVQQEQLPDNQIVPPDGGDTHTEKALVTDLLSEHLAALESYAQQGAQSSQQLDEPMNDPQNDGEEVGFEDVSATDQNAAYADEEMQLESLADQLEEFRTKFHNMLKEPSGIVSQENVEQVLKVAAQKNNEASSTKNVISSDQGNWELGAETMASGDIPAEVKAPPETTESSKMVLDDALTRLSDARATESPETIAQCIENVLVAVQKTDDYQDILSDARRYALLREVGEIYYYDLEDSKTGLKYLEMVRQEDPGGVGNAPSVLNALEAIYEEEGYADQRLKLLESRLINADNDDMANTYRLLIAQLLWDDKNDISATKKWLDEVLNNAPDHEAAHRLLAEVALAQNDFSTAARHLKKVLQVSGNGLDSVEIERELADLYLRQLSDPEAALRHYQNVVTAAPADAAALDGMKSCQVALKDWAGYLATLGKELGLLIGRLEGLSLDDLMALSSETIPAQLRITASQILSDIADIVECELEQIDDAQKLWGRAYELWPEHVEALERRIELDHRLQSHEALASDLEKYAAMLLDPTEQFTALLESARIHQKVLENDVEALRLYRESVAVAESAAISPIGLDDARKTIEMLDSGDVT